MAKRNSLAKNTMLLSMGTILTKGLSFVMVPFFSRWLSTAEYGTFDILCTYVTLLLPIIGLATNDALFRFSMDADTHEEKSKYISNCLAIFAINAIILFAVLFFLRTVFKWCLALYFFVLAFGEIFNLYLRGYLRAIKRLDVYSFASAVSTIFIAAFTTLFVRGMSLGLEGIILGYGFGYITGNIVIVVVTKYWRYFRFEIISFSGMVELVKYSYALIPNNIAWWFINVSDRTIIKLFLGATANGIYAIAYKIPNILSAVFGVFGVSWQQAATESLNDVDRDKYYNAVYNKMITILIPLCCGILSLNSWLFNFVFDLKYYEAHLYAPLLIGATLFSTLSQFYGSIQISFKQPKANGITTVIGAVANLIIHLTLIKFTGLYAATISTLLSQVLVCLLRSNSVKRRVKLKMTKMSYLFFIVYALFSVSAYYITNTLFNIATVITAAILVCYSNMDMIIKVKKKIIK